MKKSIARTLTHLLTNIRQYQERQVAKFAKDIKHHKILELGSGKPVKNTYPYSTKHLFDSGNDFLQTDINESFGHQVVDVTNMNFNSEFDIILCLNVLEHVYDYQKAADNIHKALKRGGVAIISVPFAYPLHDEPGDYWRFTEHSLRKILNKFDLVEVKYKGKREFPIAYYVEAVKR